MCRLVKKWFLKFVLISFLICHTNVKANPDLTTQIPNSANWINLLFQVGSSLGEIGNPTNWVVYSAAGTYFYYQHILKGSLRTAKTAREIMLMHLRETTLSIAQKERLIAEIDSLISELESKVKEAEKAFAEIPAHFQRLNSYRSAGKKSRFRNLKDHGAVEQWLSSNEGKVFLASQSGIEWKAKYDSLRHQSSSALDEPLKRVIEKANEVFDSKKVDVLAASLDPLDPPGTFKTQSNLSFNQNSLPVTAINKHVSNLRKECAEALSLLVIKQKQLKTDSNYVRFWTRPENLKPSLVHGIVTSGGAAGTYWLYRTYQFDKRKKEAEDEAKLKGDGSFDLGSTLRMAKSREIMRPYYQSIRMALVEHENEIIAQLNKNLSTDEKRGLDIAALVEGRLNGAAFDVAVETATLTTAKNKLGDRISFAELQSLVHQTQTEPGVREGLFRPFNRGVVLDVINSLFSELSEDGTSSRISHELIRKILTRSETLFMGQIKKPL